MKCPDCGTRHTTAERIPEHRREWRSGDGVEHTEYMPAGRHCECENCGKQWTEYDNDQ